MRWVTNALLVAGAVFWLPLLTIWPVAIVLGAGFLLVAIILYTDRKTRRSIEANVSDAVARRDRLLGRR